MKNLVLHIQYLLTQHDCVIVPRWGALVVQHAGAVVNADNTITPPHKWISFNPLLNHNDGLLAHSVMRSLQCSYAQAVKHIELQVDEWYRSVQNNESVIWDAIGRFDAQDNETVVFVESDNCIVNASFTLLNTVELPLLANILSPVIEDDIVEKEYGSEASVNEESVPSIQWHQRVWQSVASVAAIFLLMLLVSTPIDNYEASNDYASLVATEILGYTDTQLNGADLVDKCSADTIVANDLSTENNSENSNITAVCDEIIEPVAAVNIKEPNLYESHPHYILVIASLSTEKLADKRIAEFRDMGVDANIKVYKSNGKYRLYIDGYETLQQAEAQLSIVNSLHHSVFEGVWVCSTQ